MRTRRDFDIIYNTEKNCSHVSLNSSVCDNIKKLTQKLMDGNWSDLISISAIYSLFYRSSLSILFLIRVK